MNIITPSYKYCFVLSNGLFIMATKTRPNLWRRFWFWSLLGSYWEKL